MKSYLQRLENNEAILLMYLADELPPVDRAEVEQMLASDANLRAELDVLRELQESSMAAMDQLDVGARLPVSESVAVRQVMRMIRQRQADLLKKQPAPLEQHRAFPWWTYSAATAAMLLIAFLMWLGFRQGSASMSQPAPVPGISQSGTDEPEVAVVPHVLTSDEKSALLRRSFEISTAEDGDNVELAAVASKTEDAAELNLDSARGMQNP